MRGEFKPTLMRDTQIRKWFNDEGIQVGKEALYELHRYVENHLKVVTRQVKEKNITRLNYDNLCETLRECLS
tara:strand:- start:1885 stop:2100 length:216 start_codon:yes stop_codon:yes gene_type:complete